jgi:serine/threonine protein kinase
MTEPLTPEPPESPEPSEPNGPPEAAPVDDPEATRLLDDLRVVVSRRTATQTTAIARPDRLDGQRLNQYVIGRLLGEGGMAQVYRAADTELGRTVALKVLKPQCRTDSNICARFSREARSMAKIEHANVVRIFEFAESGDIGAIVMEFLPGGSLRDQLKRRESKRLPMPIPDAVDYVVQASRGIQAAHEVGIVHRDIKPSNVLLDAQGAAKVADFGAILVVEGATWLTGLGQQIGTPGYMSPEQCRGDRVTPASDVYSLGATLFELITGRLPFDVEEASPFAMMLKHISEPAPHPRKWRENVPEWLASVILRSLEKSPGSRYQTAGELGEALLAGGPETAPEAERKADRPTGWEMDVLAVRKQLQQLPQKAIVCWACRCARRIQGLNTDSRVEQALVMAEAVVAEKCEPDSRDTLSRALVRVRSLRAASLTAAYPGENTQGSQAAAEAARAAAAAAACAAARCIADAAADAAFAARSAVAALVLAKKPVKPFWQAAKSDYWKLLKVTAGQEGTIGQPIPLELFIDSA